jgi:hypothetical protein
VPGFVPNTIVESGVAMVKAKIEKIQGDIVKLGGGGLGSERDGCVQAPQVL